MSSALGRTSQLDFLIRRFPLLYRGYRDLLEQMESADLAERRAFSEVRLAQQRQWAAGLPAYRGRDFRRPWPDQPVLAKADLQSDSAAYRRTSWWPAIRAVTSGSTGRPMTLTRSLRSIVFEQATLDWLVAKAGIDAARCRVAVLRGNQFKDPNDSKPPFWQTASKSRLVFSSNHLRPDTYPHFRDALRAFAPDVLLAYPSSVELLLSLAENDPLRPSFRLVICSSEAPRGDLRARVQSIFGAKLLDYYGLAERVCIAYAFEDRQYRFVAPYGRVELMPDVAPRHRIIGTGFWNRLQPLLRYDTGDFAELPVGADAAQIERIAYGLEPFLGIDGRISDYLQRSDGSRIYAMHHIPLRVDGAATVQFLQESFDAVLAIVVPSARFSDATLDQLRQNFYREVPRNFALRFEVGDAPRRLPNGKAPLVIRPEMAGGQ